MQNISSLMDPHFICGCKKSMTPAFSIKKKRNWDTFRGSDRNTTVLSLALGKCAFFTKQLAIKWIHVALLIRQMLGFRRILVIRAMPKLVFPGSHLKIWGLFYFTCFKLCRSSYWTFVSEDSQTLYMQVSALTTPKRQSTIWMCSDNIDSHLNELMSFNIYSKLAVITTSAV